MLKIHICKLQCVWDVFHSFYCTDSVNNLPWLPNKQRFIWCYIVMKCTRTQALAVLKAISVYVIYLLNCDFCRKQENMGSATHTVCLLLCFWVSGSCYTLQTVGPCTVNRETVRKNNTLAGLFCSPSQSKCCYIRSILFVGTCFLFSVTEVYPVC